MPLSRFTRRRALALGAAAGLGSFLEVNAAGWAATSGPTRSFTLDVPGNAFAAGRRTATLRAPRRFDLLGVRGAGVRDAGVEVRVRSRGGSWGPWTPFGAGADHAPDGTRRGRLAASDPVWAGGADELQLRARRPVGGLTVHFVAISRGAKKASARAAQKAKGSQSGPPRIITRAEWGGDSVPPKEDPSFGQVQMAFVHHTVSANDYTPEQSAGIVLSMTEYHQRSNGWNDLGYNFVVDQYGQVFEGRAGGVDQAVIGAQAQGWNSVSTGVATIGTYSTVPLSDAGIEATARLIAWKLTLHGVPTQGTVALTSGGGSENRYKPGAVVELPRISGHRDGCRTSCPGDALYAQLDRIRARAGQLAGPIAATPKLTVAAAATAVPYGDDAVFTGVLSDPGGAGLAGATVSLQKQGSKAWSTVTRATTGADGSFAIRVPWRRAAAVRAAIRVSGQTVRSGPVTVALTPKLTVQSVPRRVQAGRSLLLRGTARPSGSVSVVVERSRDGVTWSRVRTLKAPVRRGRWSVRVRATKPGLYRVTPKAGTTRGTSSVFRAVRNASDVTGGAAAG